jgi:hypothetical protein
MEESEQIRSRSYFSILYIQAAAYFARESATVERTRSATYVPAEWTRDQFCVLAAILSSVAFLEATVNELLADADEGSEQLKALTEDDRKALATMWKLDPTERSPVLDKYRMVLDVLGRPPFDEGRAPFQDVKLLIRLRNVLAHFQPEWIVHRDSASMKQKDLHKFEKALRNKFPLNPIPGVANPFFPDRCLGHGCAAWAVASSVAFADEFFRRVGIKPTFDHVRGELAIA